jgi:hypothetical protein
MGGPTEAYGERIHVTIDRRGSIFLNQKAHAMMGKPLAVHLYFNRSRDMIILEPTAALTAHNAFLLKNDGSTMSGRRVFANPFCKHFGIKLDTTHKFINPETDSAGRMYLKLSETVVVARGKRPKKVNRES